MTAVDLPAVTPDHIRRAVCEELDQRLSDSETLTPDDVRRILNQMLVTMTTGRLTLVIAARAARSAWNTTPPEQES